MFKAGLINYNPKETTRSKFSRLVRLEILNHSVLQHLI